MPKQSCTDRVFPCFSSHPVLKWAEKTHCRLLRHVGNVAFVKHPNTPMTCKEEKGVIAAMIGFDRVLALSSRKWSLRAVSTKKSLLVTPAVMEPEHVTLLSWYPSLGDSEVAVSPHPGFVLNPWSKQPGGLSQSLGGQDSSSLNNIPLPHPQSPWEEWLERLHPWVVAKCSMHTSFLHPASLSQPLNLLWTQDVLFPLWAQWLMATNSSKQWWTLVPPRRPIVSMWSPLSAWCQGSEFRISASQLLNKRKISCDDFHNKAVSINWDSCCSGTEVSPHGKGHHLKRVLIAQGTDSSGYW